MNVKHQTRPTVDRIHADQVACQAARFARLAGADVTECALVYARTYAHEMAQG